MKLTTVLLVITVASWAAPAWGVTDPVGDSMGSSLGYTADLISGLVEAESGLLHFRMQFDGGLGHSFVVSLDVDQDATTGFPGAWGYRGSSISDSSLGADYLFRWDTATGTGTIGQWDGNGFPTVFEDAVGFILSSGVPLSALGGDDGLMNYKVIATEPSGAANEFVLLDVMPDAGFPASTSTIVPEPKGVALILDAMLLLVLHVRMPVRRQNNYYVQASGRAWRM